MEILRSGLRRINLWNSRIVLALAALGLIVVGGLWPASSPAAATAGINQTINFQGRLLNAAGAVVPDGVYNMRFKIYQDGTGCVSTGSSPCGGTLMWTETRENVASQGVTVKNGYFSLALGSVNAFGSSIDWNQDTLWLSTDIGGTSTGAGPTYDGEMLPFKRLSSAPYALQAQSANTCVTCILQAPTSTAQNTISPTTNSVVGLTVNATSGTSAVALAVTQSKTADAATISLTNTTGTNTNALLVNRNGSGGTTTNGIMIQNTAGTLTNGLSFSGTIGTDINRASGTLTIQGASGVTVDSGASGTITIGTASSATVNINNTANSSTTNIGTNGLANATVNIGSTGGTSATLIQGGANASGISVQTAAGGTISIGTAASSTIFIGNNATTANLVLGQSTDSNTISIGNGNTATGKTQTINIGAGTPAGTGAASITIGNTANASTLNLQAGTGNINLITNSASAGVVAKTNTNSATAFQVQNSNSANLLAIDTSTSNITILANNALGSTAGNNAGVTWTANTTNLATARARAGSVAANGYIYLIGGVVDNGNSAIGTVEYAKMSADGSVGSWTSTTSLPTSAGTGRKQFEPVVVNGYIYVIGGRDNTPAAKSTVFYAKLNTDGAVGAWQTSANSLPFPRFAAGTVAYNNYIYVMGGFDSGNTAVKTVYSAKVAPDGSVGSWTQRTDMPSSTGNTGELGGIAGAVVANGYVYLAGGYDTGGQQDDITYGKLNIDGTVNWGAVQTSLLSTGGADEDFREYVANGYLYVVGGDNDNRVVAFALGSSGAVGATPISLPDLPGAIGGSLGEASQAFANGYFYVIGGDTAVDAGGTARNTVYYGATSRVKVGGNLDLVGYSGENLVEGGSGGQLTAGNTIIVGTLQVQDAASFVGGVAIGDTLSVTSDINTGTALKVAGTSVCDTSGTVGCVAKSGSGYYIHNQTGVQTSTNFNIDGSGTAGSFLSPLFDVASAGTLGLGSSTATTINIGGAAATTISVGPTTATNTISIGNGTIAAGNTGTINIGTNATSTGKTNVTVGSTNDGSTLNLQAGTGNVNVKTSTSSINAPMLSLQQAGGGDATIELRNSGGTTSSFYIGNDTSNGNTLTIGSNSSATQTGTTTLGQDYSSQSPDATDTNATSVHATKFTAGATGTISSLSVAFDNRVDGTSTYSVAIYSDSAGTPTNKLGQHTGISTVIITTPGANNWNTQTLDSPVSITNGTVYWLVVGLGDTSPYKTRSTAISNNSFYRNAVPTVGTWGTTWTAAANGTANGTSSFELGIYGSIVSSGSLTDTFTNSLFTLSQTGAANFRNATNSTAAFQVQNASSTNLFQIDSSNNRIYIGNSTSDATAVQLVVDTSTATTDPTGVNGAIYYNSGGRGGADNSSSTYSGKFRCYEGSVWKNCVGMRDMAERRWGYLAVGGTAPSGLTATGAINSASLATSATQAADDQAETTYSKYTSTASATNAGGIDGPYTQTEARHLPKLVTRVRTDANLTAAGGRMWVGLTSASLTSVAPPTSSTANTTVILGIAYQNGTNGGKFLCVSGNGTNINGSDTGVTAANSTYYDIIIDYSTTGNLVCSIAASGGAYTTVIRTAQTPSNSTALGLYAGEILTTGTTARALSIGYAFLEFQ